MDRRAVLSKVQVHPWADKTAGTWEANNTWRAVDLGLLGWGAVAPRDTAERDRATG